VIEKGYSKEDRQDEKGHNSPDKNIELRLVYWG